VRQVGYLPVHTRCYIFFLLLSVITGMRSVNVF